MRRFAERLARRTQAAVSALPERWQWAPHNLVAHPLSEVLHQVGARRLSDWVHDATVPDHDQLTGRG